MTKQHGMVETPTMGHRMNLRDLEMFNRTEKNTNIVLLLKFRTWIICTNYSFEGPVYVI